MQNFLVTILTAFFVLTGLHSAAFAADAAKPLVTDDELTGKYCRTLCTEACAKKTPECANGYDKCTLACWGGPASSVGLAQKIGSKVADGPETCEQKARAYRMAQKFCNVEQTEDICAEAKRLQEEFQKCVTDRASGIAPVDGDSGDAKPVDGAGTKNALKAKPSRKDSGKVDTGGE